VHLRFWQEILDRGALRLKKKVVQLKKTVVDKVAGYCEELVQTGKLMPRDALVVKAGPRILGTTMKTTLSLVKRRHCGKWSCCSFQTMLRVVALPVAKLGSLTCGHFYSILLKGIVRNRKSSGRRTYSINVEGFKMFSSTGSAKEIL